MSNLRNQVQLIGNVGNTPEIKNFESGKKVSTFSLATNEYYHKEGEKIQQTGEKRYVTEILVSEILFLGSNESSFN